MRKTGLQPSAYHLFAAAIFICIVLLFFLSFKFQDVSGLPNPSVLWFVLLLIISSAPYLLAVREVLSGRVFRCSILFIFLTGLLFRILTSFSSPVLEVDYYRYMWDGAVVSEGINPYKYSPEQVLEGTTGSDALEDLAQESVGVVEQINHKHLKTIYPPVTQLFFAVSHMVSPWSLLSWKLLLVLIDIVNFYLLLGILRERNINVFNSVIYWWNPLLIVTTFNSSHFDIIPITFSLSAIFLVLRNRINSGVVFLALGVGSKLWPVIIFPLLIRPFIKTGKHIIKYGLYFIVSIALIFLPVFLSGFSPDSGFIAYSSSWENNSSAFRVFLFLFEMIIEYAGIHPGHAQRFTRIFIIFLLVILVTYLYFRRWRSEDLLSNILLVIAALFLLSPTQFPWYYTWLLPIIAFRPTWSLIILTSLLPLYYLGFYFESAVKYENIRNMIICFEFLPVWLMIIYEWKGKYISGTIS